jgi:ribosomal protein S18 acetylase RimI-like enzyme
MDSRADVALLDGSQVPAAARLLARAFADEEFFSYVLPDPTDRAAILPALIEQTVSRAQAHGVCYTTAGAPRGVAVWHMPDTTITELATFAGGFDVTAAAMGPAAIERLQSLLHFFEDLRTRLLPQPHWYLLLVGVDPAYQGQGLASRLLQPAFARADADGRPCYLETTTASNVALYARYGFSVLVEDDAPGGLHFWAMARPPRRR